MRSMPFVFLKNVHSERSILSVDDEKRKQKVFQFIFEIRDCFVRCGEYKLVLRRMWQRRENYLRKRAVVQERTVAPHITYIGSGSFRKWLQKRNG